MSIKIEEKDQEQIEKLLEKLNKEGKDTLDSFFLFCCCVHHLMVGDFFVSRRCDLQQGDSSRLEFVKMASREAVRSRSRV